MLLIFIKLFQTQAYVHKTILPNQIKILKNAAKAVLKVNLNL